MSEHRAQIRWELSGDSFIAGRYSREHIWQFDGGVIVPASPSPDAGTLRALHDEAHRQCYVANSVRTEIVVEPAAVAPAKPGG